MFSTGFSSNDDAFVQKHVEFVESLMITVKWWDPKSFENRVLESAQVDLIS